MELNALIEMLQLLMPQLQRLAERDDESGTRMDNRPELMAVLEFCTTWMSGDDLAMCRERLGEFRKIIMEDWYGR